MSTSIDFYYDFISLSSYFAFMRLSELTEGTGARINYKPVLLGGVFKATGNTSPVTIPAKWEWIKADFQRHADYYGIPFQLNPHFIFSTVNAMRGALWALSVGRIEDYNRAMFSAAWAEGKDLSSREVLRDSLIRAGFDADEVMEAMAQPEIKTALIEATDEAVSRGVFGAPTFFVKDEMHFGQDRLDWALRALD
ncbi:MAG: 2-hydroxychromene-2-carboxylate isomerase [Marinobacter sp.]|uniref:2-hydroxychromene-2-carboxylate isomerase n=1 Tax=Marinobacter sp. TaxID=50741 RepID=UPI001B4A1AD4|nr:2-hydroxychromene-2-carboxylate isomerase [Marinobacter sp.]MBQ0813185.1 2-hydroxychromene-2-carboxylate isomerase [Marinobacter sp.]|tara:strand:+ start:1012 stop:1596 length:585 start_codon:yes stop_codon:yes gene_type:complete